jgi:hypothetical protein
MKTSLLLISVVLFLVMLVACASNNSTRDPLSDENKIETIAAHTRSVIPSFTPVSTETLIPIVTNSVIKNDSDDKAQVVRLTIERALFAQEIPDYQLIADQSNIVLSTQNLDRAWVPQLDGINIILLDPKEIQAKADHEGDYLYLRFRELEIQKDGRIIVSLDNVWAVSKNSRLLYLSGGGFTIEYRRENGRWVGEVTMSWIS